MIYTVPTARVIFMAKTSLDVFSLSREQVFQSLGDRIYEIKCLFVAVGWKGDLAEMLKPERGIEPGTVFFVWD